MEEISGILLYLEGRGTEKRKEDGNNKLISKRPMPVPFWPTLSDTGLAFSTVFIMETADSESLLFLYKSVLKRSLHENPFTDGEISSVACPIYLIQLQISCGPL